MSRRRLVRGGGRLLLLAALVAGGSLMGTLIYRSTMNAKTQAGICTRIHRLDSALQTIVNKAIPTKASLNKLTYYRTHPAERDQAIHAARAAVAGELRLLRAADC